MDIRAANLRSCWRHQFKKNIQLFALSSRNWKSNFKFPYMEFPYISFSKGKEFNNEFMTDMAMLDWFWYYLHERGPMEKGRQKFGFMEKCFLLPVYYLKLKGPFAFIPVYKLSLHDKLSIYHYELWAMYNEIQCSR